MRFFTFFPYRVTSAENRFFAISDVKKGQKMGKNQKKRKKNEKKGEKGLKKGEDRVN